MMFKNILLIRTDRIGDVVLTTPAIKLLHQTYPKAKIFFLTREYTAPLLKHHPFLDDIILYKPESDHHGLAGHLKLSRELVERSIDLAFLFYPQAGIAFSLYRAGISHRVGTGYRWFSFFLNQKKYEHRKYGKRHELEYNLSLIERYILKIPLPGDISFDFTTDKTLKKIRLDTLQKYQIKKEFIIVHPGSGGSAPNLPAEKYVQIIDYLANQNSLDIILVGDLNEKELISKISAAVQVKCVKIMGDWNLETYMAVISGARYFISNSTGPLHIARAFNIPLLAFYCPAIPCAPERWGPYNRLDHVITPPVNPCKTCNIDKCPHGNCLDNISWDSIQGSLDQFLAGMKQE
jgi:heptosyltransferase-2